MSALATVEVQGGDPLVVEVILPSVTIIDIEARLDNVTVVEMVLETAPAAVDLVVALGAVTVDVATGGMEWAVAA